MLELINGKMRKPKVAALHRLITFFNLTFVIGITSTDKREGYFHIRTTETPLK